VNIAIAKIGKAILFNPDSWGARGGDMDAPVFYENLFHRNPQHKFYIVGGSDFSRLSSSAANRVNKMGNVIDVWKDLPTFRKSFVGDERMSHIAFMDEWAVKSGIKIDAGLIFTGPAGTSNVFGKTRLMKDEANLSTPLEMLCKYAGPIHSYLNLTKIPYVAVVTDPRYFPGQGKDLFHMPAVALSQYDETIRYTTRKEYDDCEKVIHKVPAKYSGIETTFLIGRKKGEALNVESGSLDDFFSDSSAQSQIQKDVNFMIVCNEGRPSRYPELKKYILDNVKDVDIYGHWEESTIGNDPRFKGAKPFSELQKMLPHVKYTFCIPIKKGWVTAKFWEMAHYGIIPFLHPTYDEQNHLHAPEFLKVTDSKDLFKKIAFLEKNPKAYDTLRQTLDSLLLDKYYSGEFCNDVAISALEEITK
jgi:hypothetical protein